MLKTKNCACGRTYSRCEWEALKVIGYHDAHYDEDKRLELRNCNCGSTITVCLPSMNFPHYSVTVMQYDWYKDEPLDW